MGALGLGSSCSESVWVRGLFKLLFEPAGVDALALGDARLVGSGCLLGLAVLREVRGVDCCICWTCSGWGPVRCFRGLCPLPATVADFWGVVLWRLSPFPPASLNGCWGASDYSSRPSCNPAVVSNTSTLSVLLGQELGRLAFYSDVGARVSGAARWAVRGCMDSPGCRSRRSARTRYQG